MNTILKLTTTFFAILILATVPAFAQETMQTIEQDLLELNDQFNDFAAALDAESIVSFYAEDSLWIAPAERPVSGPEAARATFQFLADEAGSITHTVDNLFISPDGTQAVMIGEADIFVESAGLDFTGTYLFVLERRGEEWKIVTDMFNRHVEE